MTGLLLLWLSWFLLSLGLGVAIGLSIADADRREQPGDEPEPVYVPQEWAL